MKQKSKTTLYYSVAAVLLLTVFVLSISKSSSYKAPNTHPVTVSELKTRLAAHAQQFAAAHPFEPAKLRQPKLSDAGPVASIEKPVVRPQPGAVSHPQQEQLPNTGPGFLIIPFVTIVVTCTILHELWLMKKAKGE